MPIIKAMSILEVSAIQLLKRFISMDLPPPPTGTPPSRRELRYYRLLVTSIVDTTAFLVNLNEDSFDF